MESATCQIDSILAQRKEREEHKKLMKTRPEQPAGKKSIKDNSSLIRRLRTNPHESLLTEMEKLNMSNHLAEVAEAVLVFAYKSDFLFAARFCRKMDLRYPAFMKEFLFPKLKERVKTFSEGRSNADKVSRRNVIRLLAELYLAGVLLSFTPVKQCLTLLTQPADPTANLSVIVSFLKATQVPLVGDGATLPPLLGADEAVAFKAVVNKYWERLAEHFVKTKLKHLVLGRNAAQLLQERGEVPAGKADELARSGEALARLETQVTAIAEHAGSIVPDVKLPEVVPDTTTEEDVGQAEQAPPPPFTDPNDVAFYMHLPDVAAQLPAAVLTGGADEDDTGDPDGLKIRALLGQLGKIPNHEAADRWAAEFAYLNCGKARKKLLTHLTSGLAIPMFAIPLVARAVTILTRIPNNVTTDAVTDRLFAEFTRLIKSHDKQLDARTRNARLLAELAKFGVVSTQIVFRAMHALLHPDVRTEANLLVLCTVLLACGQWLQAQDATRTALSNVVSSIDSVRQHRLTPEIDAHLTNAVLSTMPAPPHTAQPRTPKPPHVLYLRHVLSHVFEVSPAADLATHFGVAPNAVLQRAARPAASYTPDVAARIILKLDWATHYRSLASEIVRVHRHGLGHVRAIAATIARLPSPALAPDALIPGVGFLPTVTVVDGLLERIHTGLVQGERGSIVGDAHASMPAQPIIMSEQARVAHVRLLAALLVEGVVPDAVYLAVLTSIITHGARDPDQLGDNPFDGAGGWFRLALAAEMLYDTPLPALAGVAGSVARLLLILQKYAFRKPDLPLDAEFLMQDLFAANHFGAVTQRYTSEEELDAVLTPADIDAVLTGGSVRDTPPPAPTPPPLQTSARLEEEREAAERAEEARLAAEERRRAEEETEVDGALAAIIEEDATVARQIRTGRVDLRIPMCARPAPRKPDDDDDEASPRPGQVEVTVLMRKGHKPAVKTISVHEESKLGMVATRDPVEPEEPEESRGKVAEFIKGRAEAGKFDLSTSDLDEVREHRARVRKERQKLNGVHKEVINGFGNIVMHKR